MQLEQVQINFTPQAIPMTRGEYNTMRGWKIPANENPDDQGYYIQRRDIESGEVFHSAWEPVNVFERSYSSIDGEFDFSVALRLMHGGVWVKRLGWNGVGLCVRYVEGTTMATGEAVAPHFVIQKFAGDINTWVPSVSDLNAKDWVVF